jgi:sterol-4alpha-carboxylate 3-dehydrogenase (decarboxylating)
MDSVYVGSVARAHVLAAHGLLAGIEYHRSGGQAGAAPPKVDGEAFNITDDAPLPPWTFFRLFWIEMGDTTPLSKVWVIPSWITLWMAIWAEWWTWLFSGGKYRPALLIKERIEFLLYTRTYSIKKARERLAYEPMLPMAEAIRRAVAWAVEEWPEGGDVKKAG